MIKLFTHRNLKARLRGAMTALAAVVLSSVSANAQITNAAPYCQPTVGYNMGCTDYGFAFDLVRVNTLNWNRACADDPYRYWNNGPTTDLSGGVTYQITLGATGTGQYGGGYPLGFGAWIDFNQNNVFETNEYLGNFAQNSGIPARSAINFTVPCAARAGLTRMRVAMDYFTTPGPNNACNGPNYYWQYMDFNVTILQSSTPGANFAIPDTVYELATTTFINLTPTGTHQWSTSVGGLTNIISTATNLNFAFPSPGNYQVRLTTTNCAGPATVTKNVTVIRPSSSPAVEFVATQNNIPWLGSVVSVDLFDLSSFGPYQWKWELNPGPQFVEPWFISVGSETSKDITVSFFDVGTYQVCLEATNIRGTTRRCKGSYIVVGGAGGGNRYDNTMCRQTASTLDSGEIFDDGGPNGPYANNVYCTFLINPCGKSEVRLEFFGNTQIFSGDRLDIYDGVNSSAPLITSITNVTAGVPAPVVAKSGKMYMEWITNNVTTGEGFSARWSTKPGFTGPVKADFAISDTVYSCPGGTDVQFINTSQAPSDARFQWIFEYDANLDYCTTQPCYFDDDARNPVWVYTRLQRYQVRLITTSCAGNDTVVKSFVHASTTNRPIVDFTVDRNIVNVGEVIELTNMSKASCGGYWELFPRTYAFVGGTDSTRNITRVQLNGPGLYSVTYTARNANGTTVRTKSDYVRAVQYCVPSVNIPNIADVGINRVEFVEIDNESTSGSAPGYTNYSATQIANVVIGASYPITLTRTNTFNPANRRVWIDFNRDGTFDPGELVLNEGASQNPTVTGTVVIPRVDQTVVPGMTRMRVSISLGSQSNTPCGPLGVGEYEDYGVNLMLDRAAPIITLLGSDTVIIERGSTYVDDGATAFDNIEGNITSRIVTDNQVDPSQSGVFIITYNVRDGSGNPAPQVRRIVIVKEDLTPPTLTLNGANPLVHTVKTPFVDPGVTAIDNPGAVNISNLAIRTGNFDENVVAMYNVTYSVTDPYGNVATIDRMIDVVDNVAPVISLNSVDPFFVQVGTDFVDPTSVSDNYDENVRLVVTGVVNPNVFGDYRITYNATDRFGNSAAPVTRTFRVGDGIAPVLSTLPGTEVMTVDVNDFTFIEPVVSATDNYYPAVQVVRTGNFDITRLGSYVINYSATDGSGNTANWSRTINVVDRIAPIVVSAPVNIMRWTTFDRRMGVAASDNYNAPADFVFGATSGVRIEVISDNVDETTEGIYQVVYSAVDGAGNISEPYSRIVAVGENTTGLNDLGFANAIRMFPNPTSGVVNFEFNGVTSDKLDIVVLNMVGAVVAKANANTANGNVSLDLRDLAAGVYSVTITDGHRSAVKKLNITR